MTTPSYTWLYTAIHDYTQKYIAIHSYTQLYITIHSYTCLYTAIHGYTKLFHKAIMMFKIVNGLAPPYLTEMFTFNHALNNYGLRYSNYDLELPKCRTNYYKNSLLSVASRSGMLSLATSKKKGL